MQPDPDRQEREALEKLKPWDFGLSDEESEAFSIGARAGYRAALAVREEPGAKHRCCDRETLGCNCDCQERVCRMQRGESLAAIEAEEAREDTERPDDPPLRALIKDVLAWSELPLDERRENDLIDLMSRGEDGLRDTEQEHDNAG